MLVQVGGTAAHERLHGRQGIGEAAAVAGHLDFNVGTPGIIHSESLDREPGLENCISSGMSLPERSNIIIIIPYCYHILPFNNLRDLKSHLVIAIIPKTRQPFLQRHLEQSHTSIEGLSTNGRAESNGAEVLVIGVALIQKRSHV